MMISAKAEAEYFSQPHVHSGDDSRGLRDVFVDGVLCDDVTFADTELGIAVIAAKPLRVLPGTEYIDQIAVLGEVRVEPKEVD